MALVGVRRWLGVLVVLGWPAMGVIVLSNPAPGSVMRLVYILATTVVPTATALYLLPALLGDYFRTYLLGYVNGVEDSADDEDAGERPRLEVVR